MNKTALVTLWVDPKDHQIVKYTFDNVWLDFLPGAWLVRVDEMRASMTMFQPFEGVWLPRGIEIGAGITLANGSFEAGYKRGFADYRQAEVKSRIRIPKGPPTRAEPNGACPESRIDDRTRCSVRSRFATEDRTSSRRTANRGLSPSQAPRSCARFACTATRRSRTPRC